MTRRGFTLIEVMVTVLIGAATVVAAAKVAEALVRQSAKGRQATDYTARSRLLGRQLREDLRAAGLGSSGAIAVVPGDPALGGYLPVSSAGGRFSIPAVAGANRLAAGEAREGSDAIQLVVPNPRTQRFVVRRAPAGSTELPFDGDGQPFTDATCRFVYVNDQSSPTGAGRVGLFGKSGASDDGAFTHGALPFTVAPGSAVTCARVSTYWVDGDGHLHRSDWTGGALESLDGATGRVFFDPGDDQILAAGVVDLQVAHRVSAEIYRSNGMVPPAADPDAQWVFAGAGGNPDGLMASPQAWFEVRQVRYHLLLRRLRRIDDSLGRMELPGREDRSGEDLPELYRASSPAWLSGSELLVNLRLFDLGAPEGLPAEPF